MPRPRTWGSRCLLWGVLLSCVPLAAVAQPAVSWSGRAFIDYRYVLDSPVPGETGANTFDYRRLNLGAQAEVADDFTLFARLEARGQSPDRPTPFVKDFHLTWADALGPGHRLRLGVQSPPLFGLAEQTWGYRSLAQTLMDRVRANESRDFGLRADGPLVPGGAVEYGAMIANGNGVRADAPTARGKHVYGQVRVVPDGPLRAAVTVDFTSHESDEPRAQTLKTSAFLGAVTERVRGGVEAFYITIDPSDPGADTRAGLGLSAFGAVDTSARTGLVGRIDWVDDEANLRADRDEVYGLAAFVYRPARRVEIMPNVVVSVLDGLDARVESRLTAHAWF